MVQVFVFYKYQVVVNEYRKEWMARCQNVL